MLSLLAEFKPDFMAIESLFFFKNAKTVIPVAQARGVILEAAESMGVECFGYTPMQVKMHLTGYGKADKAMVQLTVQQLLDLPSIIKPDDAADAVAIAVCHLRMVIYQAPTEMESLSPLAPEANAPAIRTPNLSPAAARAAARKRQPVEAKSQLVK